MIMHRVLRIFALYSPLCASCFCTVCPGWKCGWERIWFDSMQAAPTASKI